MTNKKAEVDAITLIFSSLAIALLILIFYIWLGVSGVEKQQNSINGGIQLYLFDEKIVQEIIMNSSKYDEGLIRPRKNLAVFLYKNFNKMNSWSEYTLSEKLREKTNDYLSNHLVQQEKENFRWEYCDPDNFSLCGTNLFGQYGVSEFEGILCGEEKNVLTCGFDVYLNKETKNCVPYFREIKFPDYTYNLGRKIAKSPRIIKITAKVCI